MHDGLHAVRIVIVPVLLGYLDLGSDLFTAVSYYKLGHWILFGLALFFALAPTIITSLFFLSDSSWVRRVLVATQLSLLWEAWETVEGEDYSDILALMRVIEPLFESTPQLMLQLYALLVLWIETSSSRSRLFWRLFSVCVSALSLAYAATDVCSVERLLYVSGGGDGSMRCRVCLCCPSLTGLVFSRVPGEGSSPLKGLCKVHPHTHVWLCFVYHVLEIGSRFVSLTMLALVLRWWFIFVLPYLWGSRCLIVWITGMKSGDQVAHDSARKSLKDFGFRVRLVAMSFLDSGMEGPAAYASGLVLTLAEFIACLMIYRLYRDDDLTSSVRLVLYVAAVGCMVGKTCLALVAIFPLIEEDRNGSESIGASTLGRDDIITGESMGGSEVTVWKELKVEREVAPSEGGQRQPATHDVSTLAAGSASGDVKLGDSSEAV